MASPANHLTRPYLVLPKLISQPTWGGQYIATSKGWQTDLDLMKVKVGQSYELFSGSNLSLADTTDHPSFVYELTDSSTAANATRPAHSIPLTSLIARDPDQTLGSGRTAMNLLIKYTQALGNSFQVHLRDGVQDPKFKPKPESWYFFEPGLITLGAKPGISWSEYERVCHYIDTVIARIGSQVAAGELAFHDAQSQIERLLKDQDPWRFVNTLPVAAGELVDLTAGGIHHSWEEDAARAPKGNILYELQVDAMDDISTFRSFDKGKVGTSGQVRSLQIEEYFKAIDRTPQANDPSSHIRTAAPATKSTNYTLGHLMQSKYYNLDQLDLHAAGAIFGQDITSFRHLFVKSGRISVATEGATVTVGMAHSCFIPAGALEYHVTGLSPSSQVLISN